MELNQNMEKNAESQVKTLYQQLLNSWNNYDANGYASLFAEDGNIIGFDGSQVNGKEAIGNHLSQIFAHHKPARYVSIIREIRFAAPTVAILRAVAGMVPPGQSDINPATNAIQTLIAQKDGEGFVISVFQNTPAAFHMQPELRDQLTNELREELRNIKSE